MQIGRRISQRFSGLRRPPGVQGTTTGALLAPPPVLGDQRDRAHRGQGTAHIGMHKRLHTDVHKRLHTDVHKPCIELA
jgi:hypothetical protein